MISFEKNINNPLKCKKGFTLIEVMIVIVIIGILAAIAIPNFKLFRTKTNDTVALSDARNLVDSVINATLDEEDVDYNQGAVPAGGDVGVTDTFGNLRNPVFILSPGVQATIAGTTNILPNGTTAFSALVSHTDGTPGKTYLCVVDEANGVTILP